MVFRVSRACDRCLSMGLSCVPQVGRPSAKACQACGGAKARCSLADVTSSVGAAPSAGAAPSGSDIEVIVPTRPRARVGNAEARYREEKLVLRRESVEALKRMAASQEESTRLLKEGVGMLTDLTRRLVVSPSGPPTRPFAPRPSAVPSAAPGPSRALSGAVVSDRARKRPRAESTPALEDEDDGESEGGEEGMEE